jgi:hypothetical protein
MTTKPVPFYKLHPYIFLQHNPHSRLSSYTTAAHQFPRDYSVYPPFRAWDAQVLRGSAAGVRSANEHARAR